MLVSQRITENIVDSNDVVSNYGLTYNGTYCCLTSRIYVYKKARLNKKGIAKFVDKERQKTPKNIRLNEFETSLICSLRRLGQHFRSTIDQYETCHTTCYTFIDPVLSWVSPWSYLDKMIKVKYVENCVSLRQMIHRQLFFTRRDLSSGRIHDFLVVCKSGKLSVNFHVGTLRVDIRLRLNLNFPLEQLIIVVLISC